MYLADAFSCTDRADLPTHRCTNKEQKFITASGLMFFTSVHKSIILICAQFLVSTRMAAQICSRSSLSVSIPQKKMFDIDLSGLWSPPSKHNVNRWWNG